ncbi:39S ribosomal protein L22, mitochondrial [Neodidymelliopsis sp. IMI 364377]|nr:39S ribosomal protein L22, mitochondrial [Neodidymelliopsis sp. IMI 364377]
MSARIPSRRLGQSALAAFRPRSTHWTSVAHRNASTQPTQPTQPNTETTKDLSNPLLESYLQQQEEEAHTRALAEKGTTPTAPKQSTPNLRGGDKYSAPSPLFNPENLIPGWRADAPQTDKAAWKEQAERRKRVAEKEEEKRLLSDTLDPDVPARRRLERKLVVKGVSKHGRMTKAARIARSERQSLYKSQFLPTSVKKMTKILNQIQGKTVSEALVQLRFSPKKIARDIYKGLIVAQDEAIASRGMGLGDKTAMKRWMEQRDEVASTLANLDETTPKTKAANKLIELKDGKKKLVKDATEIYIDQAWCGKGETWGTPEFRARGRVNMLTHRTTSKPPRIFHYCSDYFLLTNHTQASHSSSRKKRHACASPTKSRRSATTANCGSLCLTGPSRRSDSTAYGRWFDVGETILVQHISETTCVNRAFRN